MQINLGGFLVIFLFFITTGYKFENLNVLDLIDKIKLSLRVL